MSVKKTRASKARVGHGDVPPPRKAAIFRKVARDSLKRLHASYEATQDGRDVLRAIFVCAQDGVPMPEWLVYAFAARYRAVMHGNAASWDDKRAFGKPHAKGTHLSKLRKRRRDVEVLFMVRKRREEGAGISKILFEEVAEELNLAGPATDKWSATEVGEAYYRACRTFPASVQPIGLPKKNRKSR